MHLFGVALVGVTTVLGIANKGLANNSAQTVNEFFGTVVDYYCISLLEVTRSALRG